MEEQLKDILQSMGKHYEKLREAELLQAYFQVSGFQVVPRV